MCADEVFRIHQLYIRVGIEPKMMTTDECLSKVSDTASN